MTTDPPRGLRRKARKRDREVLDAAISVFFEHGYDAASVQDIADRLSMFKGSLYYYIETKEDLLHRIVLEVNEGSEAVERSVVAEPDFEPLQRLDLYVRRQLDYNLSHRKHIAIYFDDAARLSPARRRDVQHRLAENEKFVAALIRAAQDADLVDPGLDPALYAQLVLGTMVWVNRSYRPGRGPGRDALIAACARYAVHGVAAATQPGPVPGLAFDHNL
jgi:TetR/AcrR family transcriptional regulator, cholesterol catabolism regulator